MRVVEFFRQMNFDGRLGKEVDLMSRYPNNDARGEYSKGPVWPDGKMPDVQTNQCLPYLEWHMPKELKTKAIQIIYPAYALTDGAIPSSADFLARTGPPKLGHFVRLILGEAAPCRSGPGGSFRKGL